MEDPENILSKPIFVPLNKWVNIQMTMSEYLGYEIRMYDMIGRLVHLENSTTALSMQRPNYNLTLF